MRTRRPDAAHQAAVSRRLALLADEVAASRPLAPSRHDATWLDDHTRVRAPLQVVADLDEPDDPHALDALDADADLVAGAARLPEPGRHAARRPSAVRVALDDAVPEPLRGRAALGPPQLAVVAVLVALGLAVTCWWVVRGDPSPAPTAPASPAVDVGTPVADLVPAAATEAAGQDAAAASPTASGTTDPATAAQPGTRVVVDVAGRVRRPGVVTLRAGARVVDALRRAGGARPGVDLTPLNLARLLVDGEQILVGRTAAAPAPTAPGVPTAPTGGTTGTAPPAASSTTGGGLTAPVDLNLADQALLETLPDVGPVTAAAIITWRQEHGGFTTVAELLEVDGIGDKTLATLTPLVTV